MKRQATEKKKILATRITNKGLIPRIERRISQQKKWKTQKSNGHKIWKGAQLNGQYIYEISYAAVGVLQWYNHMGKLFDNIH